MKIQLTRSVLLLLTLILVIFFALRLIQLNKLPIFVDEAIYVRWSQVMKNEPSLRFLPQSDGKQPLFMWITMPALKFIPDSFLAGRLVSVAAGLGSLIGISILVYLLSSSLFASALTALLYSLTPFTVFFDRMALVDSLLAMFGVWSLVIGFLFIRDRRLDQAMLLGFVLGGGMLTKSPALFFYIWQVILAVFLFRPGKNFPKSLLKLSGGWIVAFIISFAMYSILKLGPGSHLINARNQDYLYSISEVISHPLVPLLYNLQTTLSWLISLLSVSTLIFITVALLRFNRKITILFLLLSAFPLVAQGLEAKVYTSRYILFAVYPLIVIAGLGLTRLVNSKLKILSPVLLTLPLILSILYAFYPERAPMPFDMRNGYLEEWTAGTGQKEIAQYLINRNLQGKKIVVGTEGSFGTLPDGLQIYTDKYPNIIVIGTGLPVIKVPEPLANTSRINEIYFVVNKSRNQMDQSELDKLKLIASYPKAVKNNGTREELQFYQLLYQQ